MTAKAADLCVQRANQIAARKGKDLSHLTLTAFMTADAVTHGQCAPAHTHGVAVGCTPYRGGGDENILASFGGRYKAKAAGCAVKDTLA